MGSIVLSHAIQALLNETTYKKHKLEHGVRVSISKIVHYSFVFSGFLLVLYVLDVEMKSITIIGGALGVGIGFGLQGIVRNFISGLILLFERPIKVGDYITMEGQWGEIKSLGMRSAVVQTFDYSEIVVPNHDLIEQKVVNWTLSDRLMRIIVKVGVAYGSDVERVKQTLLDCAMMSSKVTRMPEPQALFMKFGDSSLDFELRVWISNIDDFAVVTSFMHEEIDKRFKKEGIVIAFPQHDVHMHPAEKPDGPK
jgi:potassium efflux system protein